MEKKRRKHESEVVALRPNEVRVTSGGTLKNYCSYVLKLLGDAEHRRVELFSATEGAIGKVITLAELVKRNVAGLHQITSVSSTAAVTELHDPDALLRDDAAYMEPVHKLGIRIVLSLDALDPATPGYQAPQSGT